MVSPSEVAQAKHLAVSSASQALGETGEDDVTAQLGSESHGRTTSHYPESKVLFVTTITYHWCMTRAPRPLPDLHRVLQLVHLGPSTMTHLYPLTDNKKSK